MNKVFVKGLEVYARHGVLDREKVNPQRFIFDVALDCDFEDAAANDDLRGTVDYSAVCDTIAEVATANSYNLLEKLAYECAYAVLDATGAHAAEITIGKPQAPVQHRFENVGVTVKAFRERAFLSLGSSLGDREKYLDKGIEKLGQTNGVTVKKISSYISSEPWGGVANNEFLNCAVEIETYLSPRALLKEINRIEEECGRKRAKRWDDRTLDIDIIFFGDKIIKEEKLVIPHPEYMKRGFVLTPLKKIAPNFFCPETGVQIKDIELPQK